MIMRRAAKSSTVSEDRPRYGAGNRVAKYMTEDDFVAWAFSAENVRAEWVNGEVILMPPESYAHLDLGLFLCEVFRRFVRAKKLGVVLFEQFQMRVPQIPSRRQPDIMFISNKRKDIIKPTYVAGAPDLALEIVSAESVTRDYEDKFREYAIAGVQELWYVDPMRKVLSAYALDETGAYVEIRAKNGRVCSIQIPGFFLKAKWLWSYEDLNPDDILKQMGIK